MDRTDARILQRLKRDSSLSLNDLADAVGLSPSACHRRVKLLEKSGVISGYAARLDRMALGLTIQAFVEISLTSQSEESLTAFEEAVTRTDEILECHMVAGGFDYLIKARVADMEAYRSFLGEVLVQMPGVRETRTYAVLEEVKNTVRLPL